MPDAMDRMLAEVNVNARPQHVPGSVPPVARRIYPVGYVPDEGEIVPEGAIPQTPAPVVEAPAAFQIEPPPAPVPTPAPAPTVTTAPTALVDVTEEWQATDSDGTPVGPPSKITGVGATQVEAYQDLAHKLRDANIKAARKIKEYREKYRTYDQEKFENAVAPTELTAEQRVEITRLMSDPATVDEGFDLIYQSRFGETPEQVRERRKKEQEASWLQIGKGETDRFLTEHPDFPTGPISKKLLLDEVQARKNAAIAEGKTFGWTAHNLEIVYDDLVERGLITPKQLEPNSEPTPAGQIAATSRASQELTPPSAIPANPSAIDANTSEATGTRPRGSRSSVMTTEHGQPPLTDTRQLDDEAFRKEVNEMSNETFKRRVKTDRKFALRVDNLKY